MTPNQIITKEIEVNEWKRKYEESRAEVLEMRYEAPLFPLILDSNYSAGVEHNIKNLEKQR